MGNKCDQFREQIGPYLFGDLEPESRKKLEGHLSDCSDCASHRAELESTLGVLRSAPEAEVPRHFFVYEPHANLSPFGLLRQMSPVWKWGLAAGFATLFLLAGAAIANFQVRFSQGAMSVAFGELPAEVQPIDLEALQTDLAAVVDEKLKVERQQWLTEVRAEFTDSLNTLDTRQRSQLAAVISKTQSFFDEKLAAESLALQSGFEDGLVRVYGTLQNQHQADMGNLNDRVDLVSVAGQLHSSQTQALTSTLMQFADLRRNQ
jgi:hypothetical protein